MSFGQETRSLSHSCTRTPHAVRARMLESQASGLKVLCVHQAPRLTHKFDDAPSQGRRLALVALHLCHWKFCCLGRAVRLKRRSQLVLHCSYGKQHSSGLMTKALTERATSTGLSCQGIKPVILQRSGTSWLHVNKTDSCCLDHEAGGIVPWSSVRIGRALRKI